MIFKSLNEIIDVKYLLEQWLAHTKYSINVGFYYSYVAVWITGVNSFYDSSLNRKCVAILSSGWQLVWHPLPFLNIQTHSLNPMVVDYLYLLLILYISLFLSVTTIVIIFSPSATSTLGTVQKWNQKVQFTKNSMRSCNATDSRSGTGTKIRVRCTHCMERNVV